MNKMRKILVMCLSAALCLFGTIAGSACGGGTNSSQSEATGSTSLSGTDSSEGTDSTSSEESPKLLYAFVPEGLLVLRSKRTVTVTAILDETLSEEDLVWKSSDEAVATVEYQGTVARIMTVARGECTITLTCGAESDSFSVIVGL